MKKTQFQESSNRFYSAPSEPSGKEDDLQDFNTKEAFTPKINNGVHYKKPLERTQEAVAPPSSLSRPNFEDILKRVSIVFHNHIQKCEQRLSLATPETFETGLFRSSQMMKFVEENFITPKFKYHFVRAPLSKMGFAYGIKEAKIQSTKPTTTEIHKFLYDLFTNASLSAECSIGKDTEYYFV